MVSLFVMSSDSASGVTQLQNMPSLLLSINLLALLQDGDMSRSNNKSTPATVIEKEVGRGRREGEGEEGRIRKGSLENKVQAFLDRLHQVKN